MPGVRLSRRAARALAGRDEGVAQGRDHLGRRDWVLDGARLVGALPAGGDLPANPRRGFPAAGAVLAGLLLAGAATRHLVPGVPSRVWRQAVAWSALALVPLLPQLSALAQPAFQAGVRPWVGELAFGGAATLLLGALAFGAQSFPAVAGRPLASSLAVGLAAGVVAGRLQPAPWLLGVAGLPLRLPALVALAVLLGWLMGLAGDGLRELARTAGRARPIVLAALGVAAVAFAGSWLGVALAVVAAAAVERGSGTGMAVAGVWGWVFGSVWALAEWEPALRDALVFLLAGVAVVAAIGLTRRRVTRDLRSNRREPLKLARRPEGGALGARIPRCESPGFSRCACFGAGGPRCCGRARSPRCSPSRSGAASLVVVLALMSGYTAALRYGVLAPSGHLVALLPPGVFGRGRGGRRGEGRRGPGRGAGRAGRVPPRDAVPPRGGAELVSVRASDAPPPFVRLGGDGGRRPARVAIGRGVARRLAARDRATLLSLQVVASGSPRGVPVVASGRCSRHRFRGARRELRGDQPRRPPPPCAGAAERGAGGVGRAIRTAPRRCARPVEKACGNGAIVTTWQENNRNLFAALRWQKISLGLVLSLVLGVGAFEVASALVVLVTEKRREFGVLLALGGPPRLVRRTLMLAGGALGGAGVVAGLGLGIAVVLVLTALGVPHFPPEIASIYMVDTIPLRSASRRPRRGAGALPGRGPRGRVPARRADLPAGTGRGVAVGLSDKAIWEVQWHPGGGGRFRRLVLTRRGLRRVLVGLGLLGVLALGVVGALPLGLKGFFTSFTVDAARRENRTLTARQDALRERSLALAGRLYAQLQRGRRLAWAVGLAEGVWRGPTQAPPAAGVPDETRAAWLAQEGARLEELGKGLAGAGAESLRCPLSTMPTGPPINESHAVAVALYGWRLSPFTGKTEAHYGTTLAAPEGEPVLAAGAGRVLFAGVVRERSTNDWTRMGNVVVVDHGGEVVTVFGHLKDVAVKRGQSVARGDRLGTVGQTGWTRVPALYYELRWPTLGGSRPIDPGLVTLSLPVEDLDARLVDPSAGLPADYPALDRLPTGGAARPIRRRPVLNDPQRRPRVRR